jgi:CheY-like chemotaxis protein
MSENEQCQILLIEDNPDDIELTLHALRKTGIVQQVQVAHDGDDALDFLFGEGKWANRDPDHRPRLILLDIKLPQLDGKDVLRRIKTDERSRHIPVVVLTGFDNAAQVDECYQLGANSFLVKPVDYAQFVEMVKNLGMYWLRLNEM